jgi:3-(3-hydroxy-phenyl)propionate hydroxylase
MPNYIGGLVIPPSVKGSIVGRMIPQPFVELTGGRRQRLDDALGNWFAVVGIHCDPLDHLGDEGRAVWNRINARFVAVRIPRDFPFGDEGTDKIPDNEDATDGPSLSSTPIVDVDGVFVEMVLARPSEQILVIRPDYYVMAACRRDAFEDVTMQIWQLIGRNAGQRLEPSAPAAP